MDALKNFLIFFPVILFISVIGFAASLSISLPQRLGSGVHVVSTVPVQVTGVKWHLTPGDYQYVGQIDITLTATSPQFGLDVYVVLEGSTGVLAQKHFAGVDVDHVDLMVTLEWALETAIPAEQITSVTVTVTKAA
jgi:hypothetical protein